MFALISIALLMIDSHLHTLTTVRQVAGTLLYPLQMVALLPVKAKDGVVNYFTSVSELQGQVARLQRQQVESAYTLQQYQMLLAENAQLRRLLGAREQVGLKSLVGQILYDARDPTARRIVLDRGTTAGVHVGLPVIDHLGVVGQVTRVFPMTSEVTLLTDKEQATPVQVLRSGLRSIAYGYAGSQLELRHVAPNADVQVGDIIVTSGLDGIYPAGLAVAKVLRVDAGGQGGFGRIICQPLGGVERNRQLLVLTDLPEPLPRPAEDDGKPAASAKKGKGAKADSKAEAGGGR
ncbi:rod shape-determining protein MreC [Massilia sp. TS11]|uniref:rod shape-determining protein MreC n=1 Tax=Massilia sp. TS11 TaxID=2908003 RepID=UPI001EDB558E|nr:rod shape-determining protein MreC [Massilia sp. TS11]